MGRVASVTALAVATFANREKAQTWLRRPTSALGDRRPIDLLDSELGAPVVEQVLYRIAHGIAASSEKVPDTFSPDTFSP